MAAQEGSSAQPINIDGDDELSNMSSSDMGSGSYGSDRVPGIAICGWRTARFHDYECSRYFDCPSHMVERALSDVDADAEAEQGRGEIASPEEVDTQMDEAQPRLGNMEDDDDSSESDVSMRGGSGNMPAPLPWANNDDVSEPPNRTSSFAAPRNREVIDLTLTPSPPLERAMRPPSGPSTSTSRALPAAPPPPPPPPHSPVASQPLPALPSLPRNPSSDAALPRWQSDAVATFCPICMTQFSWIVRKHHCRKCGRVVCNNCSPHRITIPRQYIVQPPGAPSASSYTQNILNNSVLGGGTNQSVNLGGGEKVRLCNPCVPDPNTTPHQAQPGQAAPQGNQSQRPHLRTPSGASSGGYPGDNPRRYGAYFPAAPQPDPLARSRSATMHGVISSALAQEPNRRYIPHPVQSHILVGTPPAYHPSPALQIHGPPTLPRAQRRPQSLLVPGPIASVSFPVPVPGQGPPLAQDYQWDQPGQPARARPQIAEEDECPVCHRALPDRNLPDFETKRQAHVQDCFQSHSLGSGSSNSRQSRRTAIFPYDATEKDCVDSAECTICLEEFEVGVNMARLECLCRFHNRCISAWFVKHPGQCPVHQHDSIAR